MVLPSVMQTYMQQNTVYKVNKNFKKWNKMIIHLPMAECIHTDIYPHPGMELLGHGVSICLSLRAIAKQFSKEATPIHTPTNV